MELQKLVKVIMEINEALQEVDQRLNRLETKQ